MGPEQFNPRMYDFQVTSPPDGSVSSLQFSPERLYKNFLIAGSWDNSVRLWEVEQTGVTVPRLMQIMGGPVLDVCWSDDGSQVFVASGDNQVKLWDLSSNQMMQVAAHDNVVTTCHIVRGFNYTCLMTGSLDCSLKFWDARSPQPMAIIQLPGRCYCADVDSPMAVVGVGNRSIITYALHYGPMEYRREECPLTCQPSTVAIIRNEKREPSGYALGGINGRVAIQYINPAISNYRIKCHRRTRSSGFQDIYSVNDLAVHPVHGTLATVGSDGKFCFWDEYAHTQLMASAALDQAVTKCAFNANGQIFAYALGCDGFNGRMFCNPAQKPQIYLRPCYEELRPRHPRNFQI